MSLALMLVLQAATPAAPAPLPPALAAIDFDLARFRPFDFDLGMPGRACNRNDPSAIVVCGRRSGATYPLDEMAREFEPGRILAETGLVGNVRAGIYVESVEIAPGLVSNRLTVGLRLPF